MPHTSLTKSKADTLGLFLRKVAASASRTICDFGTRRCRAVASRCALILSGILQVIVVMHFDNTELHIEQYLNHLIALHLSRCAVRHHDLVNIAPFQLGEEVSRVHSGIPASKRSTSFWKRGSLRRGSRRLSILMLPNKPCSKDVALGETFFEKTKSFLLFT